MRYATVLNVWSHVNPVIGQDYERSKEKIRQSINRIAPLDCTVSQISEQFPWIQLDCSINECLLFHGTSKSNLDLILQNGFNERFGERGLYGDGVYFAEQSCKAAQYCS